MATSSMVLSKLGLIDPTKPATYPVILGEDICGNGEPGNQTFTGVRYNFKPKHLTDKSTQRTSTLAPSDDSSPFEVTFRDNSGGRYVYAGTRVSKNSKYVLVFDSKRRVFILHRLDSVFVMNMTDTPTNHDAQALKKRYPHIDENTTRRLRQQRGGTGLGIGAGQVVRRPIVKKTAPGGVALRPMQKPVTRPAPRPATVLRGSNEIGRKTVPSGSSSGSETKASKDLRERREAIVAKEARDNRDGRDSRDSREAREKAARETALHQRSKAAAMAALAARPREGSKLSQETRASPEGKSRSSDVRPAAKAVESRSRDQTDHAKNTKDSIHVALLPVNKAQSKAGRESLVAESKSTPKAKAAGKPLPPPLAMPLPAKPVKPEKQAKPVKPAKPAKPAKTTTAAAPVAADAEKPKKKKRSDYDEEEDDDDDDGDLGIVIEYPEGPNYGRHRGGGTGGGAGRGQTQALHMPTFDEFRRSEEDTSGAADTVVALGDDMEEVGSDEEMDDQFWNVGSGDAAQAASTMNSTAPPQQAAAAAGTTSSGGAGTDDKDIDELEEALWNELEAEEPAAGGGPNDADADADLEAQLEAELMAASESESEISEEE